MMKESTKELFAFLQQHNDENLTAADVAEAMDTSVQKINGAFTMAIQRKEYGYRVEDEIELSDGTHKKVKFLKLNDKGMDFDPFDEEEK